VGVCDCQADAGSRKIENLASPKQGALYSNPGIIAVSATWRSAAIIVIDAQTASDAKSQTTQSLPHYFVLAAQTGGPRRMFTLLSYNSVERRTFAKSD